MLRTAVLCGAITGALCFAWVLFLYVSDNNPYGPKRTLSDFFPPLAAIASQVLLRRYYQPEGPGLGKSIGVGMLTALVSALVSAASAGAWIMLFGQGQIAVLTFVLTVLVYVRHWANLQRLREGTEPKIGAKKA